MQEKKISEKKLPYYFSQSLFAFSPLNINEVCSNEKFPKEKGNLGWSQSGLD